MRTSMHPHKQSFTNLRADTLATSTSHVYRLRVKPRLKAMRTLLPVSGRAEAIEVGVYLSFQAEKNWVLCVAACTIQHAQRPMHNGPHQPRAGLEAPFSAKAKVETVNTTDKKHHHHHQVQETTNTQRRKEISALVV